MARNDDEAMLIYAVRYSQGRMSYVVSDACRWVRDKWPTLSPGTRNVLSRDLQRFLELGKLCPEALGMDMDAQQWTELSTWIEAQS
jgi:hypothetical protein